MRDIDEVIKEKQLQLARVKHEIEALQIVLPLLAEDADIEGNGKSDVVKTDEPKGKRWP